MVETAADIRLTAPAFPSCGVTLAPVSTSTQADSPETTSTGDVTPRQPAFATTHWTVVLAVGKRHMPQSDHALEELCRTYWFPLYAYVRRRGHSKEDAEDLKQTFFARSLAKNYFPADLPPAATLTCIPPCLRGGAGPPN